jgi:putative MFS transporter
MQQTIGFEDAPFSAVHRKVRSGTFMGMICAGYVMGIVGIALSYAAEPLGLTSFWMGLIGAGTLLGILFGSLIIGPIADRHGRRVPYISVMYVSVLLSLSQFFISDPALLALVRFLLGMTIGWDYTVEVSLLSEWTPRAQRAKTMEVLVFYWTVGYVLAFLFGYLCNWLGEVSWRVMLCTSAVPGIISLFLRAGTPESPGWLVGRGRKEEAATIIQRYLGPEYGLPEAEKKTVSASWFNLFSKKFRYNTLVAGIFYACQVLPFFSISLFLPLVLADLHIENPHVSGVMYTVFTMVGVMIGTWLLNRISRRAFLLWTFYGAAAILGVMTIWQDMPGPVALIFLAALALMLAIAVTIEWAYPPELFPTELRASGVGLTVAVSRIGAAGGTFLLPIVSEHFGVFASLGGCIGALLFGGIVCHLWAPETSAKFIRADAPTVDGVPVPAAALRP